MTETETIMTRSVLEARGIVRRALTGLFGKADG